MSSVSARQLHAPRFGKLLKRKGFATAPSSLDEIKVVLRRNAPPLLPGCGRRVGHAQVGGELRSARPDTLNVFHAQTLRITHSARQRLLHCA